MTKRPVKTYCGGVPHYASEGESAMINENDYDEAGGEAGWVVESLRQQLENATQAFDICQQEHGRMSQQLAAFPPHSHIDALRQQLTESQAREKVLRDALERLAKLGNGDVFGNSEGNTIAYAAYTLPSDSTALDTYLEENGWRQCAKGQYITQYCGLVEEAVRQAKREALLEAASVASMEAHNQHELDTARNPRNAVIHSPDAAKWQKMAAYLRRMAEEIK